MTTDSLIALVLSILARIGLAFVVLIVGRFLAGLARGFVHKLLGRREVANALGPTMVRLLSEATYYVLLVLTLGLCIIVLGVPADYVLIASVVLLVVLAVALQQSLANFAATVIFLLFQPFRRDEVIETMGHTGIVREILLFNTVIEKADKKLVSLPNSKIQDAGVINYSRMEVVRSDVDFTVSYGANLDHVRKVLAEIAAGDSRIFADPPFLVIVNDLGENGISLQAQVWVKSDDAYNVRSDMRASIKSRFDAEGIEFALPQRNIHITSAAGLAGRDGVEPSHAGGKREGR